MQGTERYDIRRALAKDFGQVCAYCEQSCDPIATRDVSNAESIDHFRPRSLFPNLWLDWLNLIYACRRCNSSKGNQWPGFDDEMTNRILEAHRRYTPPAEYVNPNGAHGRRPAHEFFDFDSDTGEIIPAHGLEDREWSMALRTIRDIDLNDSKLGETDPAHLLNLRRNQRGLLDILIRELNARGYAESEALEVIQEFAQPDRPFSSFIRTYLTRQFPGLAEQIGAV